MKDYRRMLMKGIVNKDDFQTREDGRIEWVCSHGVGHTVYPKNNLMHGCDGCCKIFHNKTKEKKA